MHALPDAPCFQRLSGILMGVFLVKATLSPLNQKIENQGQPFQNQHQFHRMTTYVFGRHCFLHICRTGKVKLINNHKSACRWFFIFAFSKTTAGKQLSFDRVVRPCAFQLPGHRGANAQALLFLKSSGLLLGFKQPIWKTFQKLAP